MPDTNVPAVFRAVKRPGEMIFVLAAGGFIGWTASYFAQPAVHRVTFWSPFSISMVAVAVVALVAWVVGEHHTPKGGEPPGVHQKLDQLLDLAERTGGGGGGGGEVSAVAPSSEPGNDGEDAD